jgi:integrase/recombinase XerD
VLNPMTFFDLLFKMPWARNRHNKAPLSKERAKFLLHEREIGRKDVNIKQAACLLLQINRTLGFSRRLCGITHEEINRAAREWQNYSGPLSVRYPGRHSYDLYRRIARSWLRFNSCLIEPQKTRLSENRLRDFETHLRCEVGLAESTIETRSRHALYFLMWLQQFGVRLPNLTLSHVERYLEGKRKSGWAITTQILGSSSLRMFLRHAELRGWSRAGIFEAIPTFLRPKYLFIQKGPKWRDVGRMLASLSRSDRDEIRDRAMIVLMSNYGLRSGEIRGLRMSDVDFENRVFNVRRGKSDHSQRFPMNAALRVCLRSYVQRARPNSDHPSLFITFLMPYREMTRANIYARIRRLFKINRVESVTKGPHSLRHACAARLMKKGASVKAIAAFLGQRNTRSVREYTRYDVSGLRQVADFSLSGLM